MHLAEIMASVFIRFAERQAVADRRHIPTTNAERDLLGRQMPSIATPHPQHRDVALAAS